MGGRKLLIGLLILALLVLVAGLFVVLPWLRLGLAIILAIVGTYLGLGFLGLRVRGWCPACHVKKLKNINYFRANPPPNFAFYRCEECGKEYVKIDVDGESLVERGQSRFKHLGGWDDDAF